MKRQMLMLVSIVAAVGLLASTVFAGKPTVTVYFDEALSRASGDCLKPGLNTLYVVAEGFKANLTAIEYKIDLPPGMTWVKDLDVDPLKIGTTEKGITQAWPKPVDAFSPVVVARVLVNWDPEESSSAEVAVVPHPIFGFVRAVAAPDYHIIVAEGGTASGNAGDRSPAYGNAPVLNSISPNPFNPLTRITYWVPQKARVNLAIYDVAGRLIESLVNGEIERGEHTVSWQADGSPSGVYFCRLEVGAFSETKKVMLIK
jgi:hypothetical protein